MLQHYCVHLMPAFLSLLTQHYEGLAYYWPFSITIFQGFRERFTDNKMLRSSNIHLSGDADGVWDVCVDPFMKLYRYIGFSFFVV